MVGPRTPVAGPVIMCTGYNALRVRTCDVPDVPDVRRAGRAERAERAERTVDVNELIGSKVSGPRCGVRPQ